MPPIISDVMNYSVWILGSFETGTQRGLSHVGEVAELD
jgi:hypothetical protein